MTRRTRNEIIRKIENCLMTKNNIFNLSAIKREIQIDPITIKSYLPLVLKKIRKRASIINEINEIINKDINK